MPEIKFTRVLSCSSETPKNSAENIIASQPYMSWKGAAGQPSIWVVLQLDKFCSIQALDIGNEFSAFIEVLVGRTGFKDEEFQVLLPACSFMNPNESRTFTNSNRVRIFAAEQLTQSVVSQKWDQLKIVCTQPFNKQLSYGLAFIRIFEVKFDENSTKNPKCLLSEKQTSFGRFLLSDEPDESETTKIPAGFLFKNRHNNIQNLEENSTIVKTPIISLFTEMTAKRKKSPLERNHFESPISKMDVVNHAEKTKKSRVETTNELAGSSSRPSTKPPFHQFG